MRRTAAAFALAMVGLPAQAEQIPVRVGVIPVIGVSQIFVVNGEGWAREAGMDLKFTTFESGPNMIQALASGTIDVYVGGVGRAMSAFAQAAPHVFDAFAPAMMRASRNDEAPRNPAGRLHGHGDDAEERSARDTFTFPFSPYTRFTRNPADVVGTVMSRLRQRRPSASRTER